MQIGDRTGGHCVTMVRALRAGDSMILEARDPSNNGDPFTQSAWDRKSYATQMVDV